MTAGRPTKPTHLREIDGGAAHRPVPKTDMSAAPDPTASIPEPHEMLTGDALEEWERIVPELAAVGLMTEIYRGPITAYCQAWGRWVDAEEKVREIGSIVRTPNGYPVVSPYGARRASDEVRQESGSATVCLADPSTR